MRAVLCFMIFVILPGCRESGGHGSEGNPGDEAGELLVVRKWTVPADLMERLLEGPPRESEDYREANEPFVGGDRFHVPLPDLLEAYDIPFPPGTSANFSPNRGEMVVTQTATRLAEIDALLKSLGPMELFVLDEKLFHPIRELVLNGGEYPAGLATRKWHVAPEVVDGFLDSFGIQANEDVDPFADKGEAPQPTRSKARQRTLSEALEACGIEVGNGASVVYDRESATVTSVNTDRSAFHTEILLLDAAIEMSRETGEQDRVPERD